MRHGEGPVLSAGYAGCQFVPPPSRLQPYGTVLARTGLDLDPPIARGMRSLRLDGSRCADTGLLEPATLSLTPPQDDECLRTCSVLVPRRGRQTTQSPGLDLRSLGGDSASTWASTPVRFASPHAISVVVAAPAPDLGRYLDGSLIRCHGGARCDRSADRNGAG